MNAVASIPDFEAVLRGHGKALCRSAPKILQVNTGKLCNLTCVHCHVNAGPRRKEVMSGETVDTILEWLEGSGVETVDLTGGTPEMIPDFRRLVEGARAIGCNVMDRLNLTILNEPGYDWVAPFLCENKVHIIASMPCYSPENVNAQRGEGVFDSSIAALRELNRIGYGRTAELPVDLVYNPNGASLPPDQSELEADYKREMHAHFGIVFDRLYTITNMPIARFASFLKREGAYEAYLQLLVRHFNPGSVDGLMCRDTISVDWEGRVYDCDFNQQLELHHERRGSALFLRDLELADWCRRRILTGHHCFGCTAGQGSSCGGALA